MELRTLKYFLTVASELNITKAARKLNISQPPLSRQLSLLEEELGVQLFVRGKRRIQLTEEGKYLAQQAEHILNLAEHTAQQLEEMKQQTVKGTLLLGVTETCSASVLPAILPDFKTFYPQISYDIWCGNSNDVCRRIKEGITDIGIIRAPLDEQNFETVFLKTETWIAIVSRQHPLAGQTGVSLERLSREPLFIPSRQPLVQFGLRKLSDFRPVQPACRDYPSNRTKYRSSHLPGISQAVYGRPAPGLSENH